MSQMWQGVEFDGTDINRSPIKISQPLSILISNIEFLQVNSTVRRGGPWSHYLKRELIIAKINFCRIYFCQLAAITKLVGWNVLLQMQCLTQ